MDYEVARASLRAFTPPRLDYGDSAHTTSIPDTLGTLINRTLASDAVRTGEASRESSGWNLDLYGYRRPMTDPLGLRTEDRTLPKPSSPDMYPGLASVESPQNFLPSPGLQQKTDYPSAFEDWEDYLEGRYEDAPGWLKDGTPASGPVRMGGMPHEPSNSGSILPSNLPSLPPFTIPPGPSKLKENGEIVSVENPQTGLLDEDDIDWDQPFPMKTDMFPAISKEQKEESPFSWLQTDTTIVDSPPYFESFDNVFR